MQVNRFKHRLRRHSGVAMNQRTLHQVLKRLRRQGYGPGLTTSLTGISQHFGNHPLLGLAGEVVLVALKKQPSVLLSGHAVQPGARLRLRSQADVGQQLPAQCLVHKARLQPGPACVQRGETFKT